MRDVFSYDLIRDGIRMLVDAGHVALVETLAERVAAMVLAHARVAKVSVQVEKLDAGSGIVGVAIERTRETANATIGEIFPHIFPWLPTGRATVRARDASHRGETGGSHAFSATLRPWLTAIAGGAGEIVVVPGGGPFADVVREAQPRMRFDDRAAHVMALLAMAQFGHALISIGSDFGLVIAESRTEIGLALRERRVPVWSPHAMLRGAPDVPGSWSVTSDSLALWLAATIGAPQVLLIKSRPAPHAATVSLLVADGLVDEGFPEFLARYTGAVFVAGPGDVPAAALDPRRLPGVPIRALA